MKTIYIPKGETVHYESLSTDHLIVEGTLEVTYGVVAKQIDGDGVIHAGTVEADIIRIHRHKYSDGRKARNASVPCLSCKLCRWRGDIP